MSISDNAAEFAGAVQGFADRLNTFGAFGEKICRFFNAERLTVYVADPGADSITAMLLMGLQGRGTFRLGISNTSIAGYAALSKKAFNIANAYDAAELKRHDPELHFLPYVDQRVGFKTTQVLAAPILDPNHRLIGVVQLLNHRGEGHFPAQALTRIEGLCRALAPVLDPLPYCTRLIEQMVVDACRDGQEEIHIKCPSSGLASVVFEGKEVKPDYIEITAGYRAILVARLKAMANGGSFRMTAGAVGTVELRLETQPDDSGVEDVRLRIAYVDAPLARFGKYRWLVEQGFLSLEHMQKVESIARIRRFSMDHVMIVSRYTVPLEAIGTALQHHYRVPYEPYKARRPRPSKLLRQWNIEKHSNWLPLGEKSRTVVILCDGDPDQIRDAGQPASVYPGAEIEYRVTTRGEFEATRDDFLAEDSSVEEADASSAFIDETPTLESENAGFGHFARQDDAAVAAGIRERQAARQAAIDLTRNLYPEVAAASSCFALDLYAKLGKKEENLVFSPFSVFAALAMTLASARGETAAQMAAVLRLPRTDDAVHAAAGVFLGLVLGKNSKQRCALHIANALWKRQGLGLLPAFSVLLREHYDAVPREADFERDTEGACRKINAWVAQQTRGLIRDLLEPFVHVTPDTLVVLVNALYFKANWHTQFSETDTRLLDFFLAGGRTISVPTMHMAQESRQFGYCDCGTFRMLELAYEDAALSMIFVLPNETDGLEDLESRLGAELLRESIDALEPAWVRMHIPKFKIEVGAALKEVLIAMGMPLPFGGAADFSAMTLDEPVMIGQVVHQAFIEVNEEGTEAAAATAVVEYTTGISETPSKWVEFRADHPFLFVIRHRETGGLLFMGRVAHP